MCDNALITSFHSFKRQTVRTEDGRLVVIFFLNSLKKKHITYKVGYSFGLHDNSFQAEFYTQDDRRFENDTPLFLIDRFKALDTNMKGYRFYKHCGYCKRYTYSSNRITPINYSDPRIQELHIASESIGMVSVLGPENYRIIRMDNNLKEGLTQVSCWKADHMLGCSVEYPASWDADSLSLPLIPFVSKEETMDRILTLLTFS